MKLFFRYWKQNGKSLAVGLVFWLIFLAAFALYHLPMAAVLYPSAVCAVLGAAFTAWDYGRVREKHKVLRHIQENVDLPAVLPPDGTIDGQDYQAIIRLQQQAREKLEEETSLRYSELVDYYTLWTHQIKTPIAAMRLTLQKEDSASSRRLSAELFRVEQYVEMALVFLKLDEAASDYVIREHDLDAILKQI